MGRWCDNKKQSVTPGQSTEQHSERLQTKQITTTSRVPENSRVSGDTRV